MLQSQLWILCHVLMSIVASVGGEFDISGELFDFTRRMWGFPLLELQRGHMYSKPSVFAYSCKKIEGESNPLVCFVSVEWFYISTLSEENWWIWQNNEKRAYLESSESRSLITSKVSPLIANATINPVAFSSTALHYREGVNTYFAFKWQM